MQTAADEVQNCQFAHAQRNEGVIVLLGVYRDRRPRVGKARQKFPREKLDRIVAANGTTIAFGDQLLDERAFVEPEYKSFTEVTPGGEIDRSGNTFSYIPHETFSLGGSWRLPFRPADGSGFVLSADYYWQSEVYFSEFNDPTNFQDSYGLLNGRLEWSKPFGANDVSIALWGRNLTAEEYFVSAGGNYVSSGYTYNGIGDPRTCGLELRVDF